MAMVIQIETEFSQNTRYTRKRFVSWHLFMKCINEYMN